MQDNMRLSKKPEEALYEQRREMNGPNPGIGVRSGTLRWNWRERG